MTRVLDMNSNKTAIHRYYRELAITMTIYAVLLIGSITAINLGLVAGPWKYLVVLLPMIPAGFVPLTAIRFLRQIDEMQRLIQLEALAFAFTVSALITFGYGFLEAVGLPHLNWTLVWPIMGVSWAVGLLIAHRRYE